MGLREKPLVVSHAPGSAAAEQAAADRYRGEGGRYAPPRAAAAAGGEEGSKEEEVEEVEDLEAAGDALEVRGGGGLGGTAIAAAWPSMCAPCSRELDSTADCLGCCSAVNSAARAGGAASLPRGMHRVRPRPTFHAVSFALPQVALPEALNEEEEFDLMEKLHGLRTGSRR